MCGYLRTDALNSYRSISGITGHPMKNQKKLAINLSYPFAVGCNNPMQHISFRSQMAVKLGGYLKKIALPL
jgi:hypothetical protein